jgi:hypothetical protein
MRVFLEHVLVPLLTVLGQIGWRWLKRRRFWKRITTRAQSYIADARVPITDPVEATERALLDEQRVTIQQAARVVKESIPPVFTKSGKLPRLGSQHEAERDPGKSG